MLIGVGEDIAPLLVAVPLRAALAASVGSAHWLSLSAGPAEGFRLPAEQFSDCFAYRNTPTRYENTDEFVKLFGGFL